ncbi:hypothetical protein D9M69_598610 [compost metagenome]
MAGGAQDQQLEIRIVARGARALDAVQLLQIELAVTTAAGHNPPAHVGKQLALLVRQVCGLLQDAGTARVVDHVAVCLVARLEQQFAVRRGQLALHACLADMGGVLPLTLEQLASGEQRKQGNED